MRNEFELSLDVRKVDRVFGVLLSLYTLCFEEKPSPNFIEGKRVKCENYFLQILQLALYQQIEKTQQACLLSLYYFLL